MCVKISGHNEVDAMSLFSWVALSRARVNSPWSNLGLEASSVFLAHSKQSILYCSKGHMTRFLLDLGEWGFAVPFLSVQDSVGLKET